jgi:hypothetical protein
MDAPKMAPAGGAAAAAPEGGALAGPPASPHIPVVGAGNPVAVPGVAARSAGSTALGKALYIGLLKI